MEQWELENEIDAATVKIKSLLSDKLSNSEIREVVAVLNHLKQKVRSSPIT